MTEGYVEVGGNRFFHRWEGPADGPVVMMAHAMGTSHRIWDRQVPALAGRYQLLLYDWRGHGASDAPEGPYSLDGFVSDAVGIMDALGLGQVIFVGISTGGMIAQGVAIGHPDRVRAAALCNTMARATPWYRQWVVERQAVVRASGMAPVWDMTHKLWFSDAYRRCRRAGLRGNSRHLQRDGHYRLSGGHLGRRRTRLSGPAGPDLLPGPGAGRGRRPGDAACSRRGTPQRHCRGRTGYAAGAAPLLECRGAGGSSTRRCRAFLDRVTSPRR